MSTVVKFLGKDCIEPGSYAATSYNPTSTVNAANFGNVMIIDTGLSATEEYEFSGGAGIKGENAKGLKSVYEFESIEDFSKFVGGGILPDIAKNLFKPIDGSVGIPKLFYVRAATTVSARIVFDFLTQGKFTLVCKNEGAFGNGVAVDSVLKTGYSAKILAGTTEGTFKLQIIQGSYQGLDKSGENYGSKSLADSVPVLIGESPECTTIAQLNTWALSNKNVMANFKVISEPLLLGTLSAVDTILATGGTTTFVADGELEEVLDYIPELDFTFFLCTDFGTNAVSTNNSQLLTYVKTKAKYGQFLAIAAGSDDSDLFGTDTADSEYVAKYYNDAKVVVIHGAPEVARKDGNGVKTLDSIYLASDIIGINGGLAPQTPLTFKRVGYSNFAYDLKLKEREKALQAGIMHVRNVNGRWCINQGVTSLQDNKKMIADDGNSMELSIELIKAQINKELIIDATVRFTGDTAAQASPESVKNFTETKLASFVARPGSDNLIISWKNVKVVATNGDYYITYDFVPNVPVNKTFFVGNMLDFSVTV